MNDSTLIPDADFSFVRYANCWEDPRLLMDGLKPAPGKRILSIASAGDNSLSLLASGAEVMATDLNPAQLACVRLRKEAIRTLEHNEFLALAGITETNDRMVLYNRIRPALDEDTRSYWDGHPQAITDGFIHAGKFEHYFQLFRSRIIPLIHNRRTVDELLQEKSMEERRGFYSKRWNNRRWRLLFRLFFSRHMMGRHGRDPEFFRHVEGQVSTRILERTAYALTVLDTSKNPYLRYILTGNFTHALPHYLQPDHYQAIRQNIDNLTIFEGSIDAIAAQHGPASFDGFNLSDIFEYLDEKQCEQVYTRLLDSARPGARLAYWNMLVPRQCPAALQHRIETLEDEARSLFNRDMAFFYSRFVLEAVR